MPGRYEWSCLSHATYLEASREQNGKERDWRKGVMDGDCGECGSLWGTGELEVSAQAHAEKTQITVGR